MIHVPVMTREVLSYLLHDDTRLVVDATIGAGGHAAAILEANANVRIIGIDRDQAALREAESSLRPFADRLQLVRGSFTEITASLSGGERADGILADLGLSSLQIDRADRGFSHGADGPLDMRMSVDGETARELVRRSDEKELRRILGEYGEVTRPARIAREIHSRAQEGNMNTTRDLRQAVDAALKGSAPPRLLSKVFQAIRIVVNDELGNLQRLLDTAIECLNQNGRLVVIAYHSLEDRIVKEFLKHESTDCVCPPTFPVCTCGHKRTLEILTRRVIKPAQQEIENNPRARSARLRAARVV